MSILSNLSYSYQKCMDIFYQYRPTAHFTHTHINDLCKGKTLEISDFQMSVHFI